MLALGSGDPTRAICSSLIARAFQLIHYPILPNRRDVEKHDNLFARQVAAEIFQIRHHSLFTPRDFDLSPYFRIIKPTLDGSFDYRQLTWYEDPADQPPPNEETA